MSWLVILDDHSKAWERFKEMVLSNKKLKQKLRTALTESLTALEASKATGKDVPSDANPPTFKKLFGSAAQKPRMTKREKRREKMGSLEGFEGPKEKKMKTHVENGMIEAPVKVEVEIGEVYVGGIPYYSTEDDIRSFFESCGTITEMDCMTFPESGKFRGIALLTFKTEAAAKRALALDGADMGGLYLKIQPFKAATRPQKPDFEPKIIDGYNRIYVGNLSYDITEDELKMLFSDCKVSSMRLGKDKTTGEFRGYAHVDFNDSVSLAIALKLDQKGYNGVCVIEEHWRTLKQVEGVREALFSRLLKYKKNYLRTMPLSSKHKHQKVFGLTVALC
ncbi:Splicing factor U2af large subunit B [Acorus calamus]|uniref:Splicing factor U2af large subunit B n=1 Tax=Acorus calamus TaxID=4465 RepID=A0AAV9CAU7_ACOCL|nr:Splicing factor U2af large subunit B [Acorus calamus]